MAGGAAPFGDILREQRLATDLTQEALAERAGVSVRAIQALERGEHRPQRATLERLMDSLALDAEQRHRLRLAGEPRPRAGTAWPTEAASPPPAPSPPSTATRVLPADLSSFVGRRREVAHASRLMARTRLLTVTGLGGVGKTRLALAVARNRQKTFPDGVALVELAGVRDRSAVAPALLAALGVDADGSDVGLANVVAGALRDRRMLLVVDNCEHLLAAVATVVAQLLRWCPGLRVLATSRQPLGVEGEVVLELTPLEVPVAGGLESPRGLARCDAIRLLVERAAAADPGFELTAANAGVIAQLCRQLEGLPLAIELAAGRLRALEADQLGAQLSQRISVLRALAPGRGRQETLAATLDWSHDLLDAEGQALWRRLAVFVGGWTLEMAQAAGADFGLPPAQTVELLAQLVECSLVVRQGHAAGARYRMLDLVRAYAWERLERAGEQARAIACHRQIFLTLASRAAARWWGPDEREVLEQLEADHDNFQAALQWCVGEPSAGEAGLALGADLQVLWVSRGHMAEGRRYLGQLLERETHPTPARARATLVAGFLTMQLRDPVSAARWLSESVELARAIDDPVTAARALAYLSGTASANGQLDQAVPLADQAVAVARQTADSYSIVIALNFRALLAARARDFGEGAALFQEAVDICQQDGERWMRQRQQQGLARCLAAQGQLDAAERHLRESLEFADQLQDWRGIANSIEGLARIAITRGDDRLGAMLLGAADPIWQASVGGVSTVWSDWHADSQRLARARLGERAFQAAWRRGAGLSMAEIVSQLLKHDEPRHGPTPLLPAASSGRPRKTV